MSLILAIDTALENATVALCKDGEVLVAMENREQKDHAAWLHPAVDSLLHQTDIVLTQLDAVSVSIGPGSYTGLRVGLSSAKGYCFSLQVPLITIGTLEIMAETVRDEAADLICPLIDARRMEVYAAVYDKNMTELTAPHALIIDEFSFAQLLDKRQVLFCGNGSKKLQNLLNHPHARFNIDQSPANSLARLSQKKWLEAKFADLAYATPLYVKEFYTTGRRN